MASSTASRLSTGSAPGRPRQTGHTLVFGGAPKPVGQPQKILVAVASCTWTSRPITGSYRAIISGVAAAVGEEDMVSFHYSYSWTSGIRLCLVHPSAARTWTLAMFRWLRRMGGTCFSY